MSSSDTPLMAQYDAIKRQHTDGVLFFRLGDFYEMFGNDAVRVSKLLNLTLTHRAERPMCGVPCKAATTYIARLLRFGQTVVICDQVGDVPAHGKGLTERKVTEIITPGTVVEDEYLAGGEANYLAAIAMTNGQMGFAFIDVTTGDFRATSWKMNNSDVANRLEEEIGRIVPREVLLSQSLQGNAAVNLALKRALVGTVSYYPDWDFDVNKGYKLLTKQFHVESLKAYGLDEQSAEIAPAGFLLDYLSHIVRRSTSHVQDIEIYRHNEYLIVDDESRRSLEILLNANDGTEQYTLAECVNFALTPMGNREVRRRLLFPLIDVNAIKSRQDRTARFADNPPLLAEIRRLLSPMLDIERLSTRISMGKAHPKDMVALRDSLVQYLAVKDCLKDAMRGAGSAAVSAFPDAGGSPAINGGDYAYRTIATGRAIVNNSTAFNNSTALDDSVTVNDSTTVNDSDMDLCRGYNVNTVQADTIINTIRRAILDDPATSLTEGRIIREGWSQELDHWRRVHDDFDGELARYEAQEREATGIATLKVRSTGNSGLFIDVSRTKTALVPKRYILRRSTVSGDRYTTEELEALDRELSESGARMLEIERDLFVSLRNDLCQYIPYLQSVAKEVSDVDATQAAAQAAVVHGWVRPSVDKSLVLDIAAGRHPVVEAHLMSGEFVPNDTLLRGTEQSFALVTGPNMAGKSTYLRQNALIVLLAQSGFFVPAASAHIGIVDRIFCRVGASDNLARGESTFLVEMTETANILRNATERSLVIMDEVGRGTSTEDGLAIATAVAEHLLNRIGCRTLFATHYQELGRMEHTALIKLRMEVSDDGGRVVFLRRVCAGVAKSSYGIHVAAMAGIPQCVIERARVILERNAALYDGEKDAATSRANAARKTNGRAIGKARKKTAQSTSISGGASPSDAPSVNVICDADSMSYEIAYDAEGLQPCLFDMP